MTGAFIAICVLSACSRDNQPPASQVDSPATRVDPHPRWVIRQAVKPEIALVYVHGFTGDMIETWRAPNGRLFFDLVNENELLKGKADAFVYGFPSALFRRGSFDVQQAADRLHQRLAYSGVFEYRSIVFVAHSMGGLVVLRELLTHRDELEKVPLIMLYATPMEGAVIAEIGKRFSPNTALSDLTPADGNKLLMTLDSEWRSLDRQKLPHIRCAYETVPVGPEKIVSWQSATRLCEGATPAIEASHITIVKPDRSDSDAIVYLANALRENVFAKERVPATGSAAVAGSGLARAEPVAIEPAVVPKAVEPRALAPKVLESKAVAPQVVEPAVLAPASVGSAAAAPGPLVLSNTSVEVQLPRTPLDEAMLRRAAGKLETSQGEAATGLLVTFRRSSAPIPNEGAWTYSAVMTVAMRDRREISCRRELTVAGYKLATDDVAKPDKTTELARQAEQGVQAFIQTQGKSCL